MTRSAVALVALGVALSGAGAAQAASRAPDPKDKVTTNHRVEMVVSGSSADAGRNSLGRGKATTYRVVGGKKSHAKALRPAVAAKGTLSRQAARTSGYECVVKTDRTGRLKSFDPLRYSVSGRSFSLRYVMHPYLLNKARVVSGKMRKQWEFCVTGGGDVWNGYKQTMNGAAISFNRKADKTIGSKWGTKVTNGAVSSTLSLEVGKGPVKIGASTTVADKDRHTGSTGRDGDFGTISTMEKYNANRINTAYKSGRTWRWQGSSDLQGNNGHLLVELRQRDSKAASWSLYATNRAHCSKPFGAGCGDYN